MNLKNLAYLIFIAIVSVVLFSCYKTKNFSTNLSGQIDSAIVIQSYDQARVTAVIDEVFNDVNRALSNQSAVTGANTPRTGRYGVTVTGGPLDTLTVSGLCNVQVLMDTTDIPHYISLYYYGASCDNSRNLLGNVTIYFNAGSSWSAAGDTIGVNFNHLTVQGIQDTNTIRLNGTFYYANLSGGSLSTLTSAGSTPVVHEIISPYLGVIYNSADTATWQVARKRTYSYNNGIVISTTGADSVDGVAGVSEWGGNRFGNSFINAITTPLVASSGCNYQLSSGQEQLSNPEGVTTLSFGLNASGGAATACPTAGGFYYFQFSWTGSDSSPYSSVRPVPYW